MSKFTSQFDYMEALRRSLAGLPPDIINATLAEYQQRFLDGLSAGQNEAEIAYSLAEPIVVAARLRKSSDLVVFQEKKSVPTALRIFFSGLGLLVFNFFMVIPAIVYSALMFALYVTSIAIYISGVAVTSSSLAGVNELVIDGPLRHVIVQRHEDGSQQLDDRHGRLNIQFNSNGVRIGPEDGPMDEEVGHGTVIIGNGNGFDEDSRTMGAVKGVGLIVGGILLILLAMVLTRFSWIALKRYFQLNVGLLTGR